MNIIYQNKYFHMILNTPSKGTDQEQTRSD